MRPWTRTLFLLAQVIAASLALAPQRAAADADANRLAVGEEHFQVFAAASEEAYDASFTLTPADGEAVSDTRFLFGVQDAENHYELRVRGGQVSLLRRLGGEERGLDRAEAPEWGGGQAARVTIRRRPMWLAVLFDDVEFLRTHDGAFAAGGVGAWLGGQPVRLGQWSLRRFSPVDLTDGFMRTDEDRNPWQTLRGSWQLHTVRDVETAYDERRGRDLEAERSANFFSYEAEGGAPGEWALCASGDRRWSDTEAEVSIRSRGGWAGLAVGVRSPGDFVLLRWKLTSLRLVPSPVELVAFRDGEPQVLARALAPGSAQQWYRLGLSTMGRRLTAEIDGTEIFDLTVDFPLNGRVGLYAKSEQGTLFDDVSVTTNPALRFDTPEALARAEIGDGFEIEEVEGHPGDTPRARLARSGDGDAALRFGAAEWESYILQARSAFDAEGASVSLAMEEAENRAVRAVYTRTGATGGTVALVTEAGGDAEEHAAVPFAMPESGEIELRMDCTERGAVRVFAGGKLLFRAPHAPSGPARPAVAVSGPGTIAVSGLRVSSRGRYDASRDVQRRLFATDAYMVGWASDVGAWVQDEKNQRLHWHKSDFYGPYNAYVPTNPGTRLYLSGTREDPDSGWVVALSAKDNAPHVQVTRSGETEFESSLKGFLHDGSDSTHLAIAREGHSLRLAVADREITTIISEDPPRGTRVAGVFPGNTMEKVELTQYNVKDYLFTEAPTDWRTTGTWEVTTRFVCDPRWSWYSAMVWDALGMAWNKFQFSGDTTIEFYAGMRHETGRGSNYPRPGEINVNLFGDGANLSTGYSVVINGWDELWSGRESFILRDGRQVAHANRELVPSNRLGNPRSRAIPVAWDPGGRPLHGAWYYIKVRKTGERVEVYFDNVLVMTYDDPNPLDAGRVAIWTMDNSLMVARVRVAYSGIEDPPLDFERLSADEPLEAEAAPPAQAIVASSTHPGMLCSFEHGLDGWANEGGDQGAELSLEDTPEGRSLKLTNIASGGSFGAARAVPGLDLARVSDLSFRYRIPPEARVNLHMTIDGVEHFVRLTGSGESNENMVKLGAFPDVEADGQWRETSFDLAAAALELYPGAESLKTDEVRFGWYHPGYGLAGLEGNPEGAAWRLDDFRIVSAGGPRARFAVKGPEGAPVEYAYSVTAGEPGDPGDAVASANPAVAVEKEEDGLYYLNGRARADGNGEWMAATTVPFRVATKPLSVAELDPAEGAEWGGNPIAVRFDGPLATQANLGKARLRVNGEELTRATDWLRAAPDRNGLLVDINRSGLAFDDGDVVAFSLSLPARYGGAESARMEWSHTYRRAADTAPPTGVRLLDYPLSLTFDDPRDLEKVDAPGHTSVRLAPRDNGGDRALRVFNRSLGGNFAAIFHQGRVHAGRNPLLLFDYRIPPMVSVDWAVAFNGETRLIEFTDLSPGGNRSRASVNVVDDGRWHTATVNLRSIAEELDGFHKPYDLRRIWSLDSGYSANAPGARFYVDNVRLAPAVGKSGVAVKWEARDTSGIEGYAVKWSTEPRGDPGDEITTNESEARFDALPDGLAYLHIRAFDRAGNAGPVSSYPFFVDNAPPEVIVPRRPGVSQDESFRVRFGDDKSGVDLRSVTVKLDDPETTLSPSHARFLPRTNLLHWEWLAQAEPAFGAVPDGTTRVFRVLPFEDFAGNRGEAAEWEMTIRHEDDRTPPTVPMLDVEGARTLVWQPFLDGNPGEALPNTRVELVERRRGEQCLHIAPTQRTAYGIDLYKDKEGYNLAEYPWLAFDYRFPENSRISMQVEINGRTLGVRMTGPAGETDRNARARGIREDGRWRSEVIDLFDLADNAIGGRDELRVTKITIGRNRNANETDGIHLDNFAIFGDTAGEVTVRAAARDLTGIGAFAFEAHADADRSPSPDLAVERPEWRLEGAPEGLSYIHVRARDGAGNWGEAARYPISYRPKPNGENADQAE